MSTRIRLKRMNAYGLTTLELIGPEIDLELRLVSRQGKRERRAVARSLLAQIRPWLRYFTHSALGHAGHGEICDQRALTREFRPLQTRPLSSVEGALGYKIRMRRLETGITQAELAEEIGVSRSHLSSIERGLHWPHPGTRERIEHALKIDLGSGLLRDASPTEAPMSDEVGHTEDDLEPTPLH